MTTQAAMLLLFTLLLCVGLAAYAWVTLGRAEQMLSRAQAHGAVRVDDQLELGRCYRVWQRAMLDNGGAPASQDREVLSTRKARIELLCRARLEDQIAVVCHGRSNRMAENVVQGLKTAFGLSCAHEAVEALMSYRMQDSSAQAEVASQPTGKHTVVSA